MHDACVCACLRVYARVWACACIHARTWPGTRCRCGRWRSSCRSARGPGRWLWAWCRSLAPPLERAGAWAEPSSWPPRPPPWWVSPADPAEKQWRGSETCPMRLCTLTLFRPGGRGGSARAPIADGDSGRRLYALQPRSVPARSLPRLWLWPTSLSSPEPGGGVSNLALPIMQQKEPRRGLTTARWLHLRKPPWKSR